MTDDARQCAALLKKSVAFNQLSDEQLLALSKLAEKVTYGEHEVVHAEKQRQNALYTVQSGRIQRERHDDKGQVCVAGAACRSCLSCMSCMSCVSCVSCACLMIRFALLSCT